jgi:hypothetical protein
MLRFVSGVVFGCLLSIVGSAFAAGVVGSGTLDGWNRHQGGPGGTVLIQKWIQSEKKFSVTREHRQLSMRKEKLCVLSPA